LCIKLGGLPPSPPKDTIEDVVRNEAKSVAKATRKNPFSAPLGIVVDGLGLAYDIDKEAKTIAGYPYEDVQAAATKAREWFEQLAKEAAANADVRKIEAELAGCFVADLRPPAMRP
jgi:hypothetical protein